MLQISTENSNLSELGSSSEFHPKLISTELIDKCNYNSNSLNDLNDDMLLEVFQYLDEKSLVSASKAHQR